MSIVIIIIIVIILAAVGFWEGVLMAIGFGLIGGVLTWIFGDSFSAGWYGGLILGAIVYVWQCIELIREGESTILHYNDDYQIVGKEYVNNRIKGIIGLCVVGFLAITVIYNRIQTKSGSSVAKTQTEYTTPRTTPYRCTANVLNVRTSPFGSGSILGTIKRNDIVYVYGVNNGFAQISFNGRNAYVSMKYLEISR